MDLNTFVSTVKKSHYPELRFIKVFGKREYIPDLIDFTAGKARTGYSAFRYRIGFAVITITPSVVDYCPLDGLKGLIAHELSHVAFPLYTENEIDADVKRRGLENELQTFEEFIKDRFTESND